MKLYLAFAVVVAGCLVLLITRDNAAVDSSTLTIELLRTGGKTDIFVDRRRQEPDRLVSVIKTRLAAVPICVDDLGTHPDIDVVLRGNPQIEFGAFRPVLEACRECGIHLVRVDSGREDAPLFIFYPYDLRRGMDAGTPAASFHPPWIKLLWVQPDSRRETNSLDGRVLLKIKDIILETQTSENAASPDYEKLHGILSKALKYFQYPLKSYPNLTTEITAHWNVPFGVVVHCASIVEDVGISECFLRDLPLKCSDDWDFSDTKKYDIYNRQVDYITRKRASGK